MDLLTTRLKQKNDEKNKIIIRIASLTDPVLLEQAKEDYVIIEEKIADIECEIKQLEHIVEIETLRCKYIHDSSLINALSITNDMPGLEQQLKAKRVMIPQDVNDRRKLFQMCRALNCSLNILDLENNVIDSINQKDAINKTMIVHVNWVNRFDKYDKTNFNNKLNVVIPLVVL